MIKEFGISWKGVIATDDYSDQDQSYGGGPHQGYIRLIPPLQSSPPEVQAVSSPAVSPQFLQVTVTMWGGGEVSKWITSCQLFFIEFRGETNLLVLPRPLCKASPWPRSLRFSASILLCALGSFPNRYLHTCGKGSSALIGYLT